DDLTTMCRSMAQDLDADKGAQDTAEATIDKQAKMGAWCHLAVEAISAMKAQTGAFTINARAPKCSTPVRAKVDCQTKCAAGVTCDLKTSPPTCQGGTLEVSCSGECTAQVGTSVSCEGECTGTCEGSCTAQSGVQCQGKCEGTCRSSAQGGTGTGTTPDGSC